MQRSIIRRYAENLKTWFATGPVLAVCTLALAASVWYGSISKWKTEGYTPKGDTTFHLLLNGRQLHSDEVGCAPGDTLEIALTSREPVHFSIFYRHDSDSTQDGNRGAQEVEEIFPAYGGGKVGGRIGGDKIPGRIVLASGFKRNSLYCLWAKEPIPTQKVKAELAKVIEERAKMTGHDTTMGYVVQVFTLHNIQEKR